MKNRLDIVRALYDEVDAPERLQTDPGYRAEYEALSEVKARLDGRDRVRPDSDVLASVFAAAAAQGGPRADRRPVPPRGARFRALWASGAATAVVALLAVSLWQIGVEPGDSILGPLGGQEQAEASPVANVPSAEDQTVTDAAPPSDRIAPGAAREERVLSAELVPSAEKRSGASLDALAARESTAADGRGQQQALLVEGAFMPDSALSWDAAGDLLEVHRTIERLQASTDLMWDEPVVPLELLGTGAPTRGLHEAGQRK